MKRMLSLFDYTTETCRPWAEAGYECWAIDIQHFYDESVENFPSGGSIRKASFDLLDEFFINFLSRAEWNFIAAFPPCTHLAVSGAGHFKKKDRETPELLRDALKMVHNAHAICEASGAPYFIENPVSRLATLWRRPDYYFHPYDYQYLCEEDTYSKKTCLWTGGGFIMPPKKEFTGVIDTKKIHHCPPGPERANIRSATPKGFARAIYLANGKPNWA